MNSFENITTNFAIIQKPDGKGTNRVGVTSDFKGWLKDLLEVNSVPFQIEGDGYEYKQSGQTHILTIFNIGGVDIKSLL